MQGRMKISQHEPFSLEFSLDNLKDCDFLPLFELFVDIDDSAIHRIDIYNKKICVMNGAYVLSLLRALSKKLHVVHLNDLSLERGFLRYVISYMKWNLCNWYQFFGWNYFLEVLLFGVTWEWIVYKRKLFLYMTTKSYFSPLEIGEKYFLI